MQALNINPSKTVKDGQHESVRDAVSAISTELSELLGGDTSRFAALPSGIDPDDFGDGFFDEDDEESDIGDEARDRLLELLADPQTDEAEAELILGVLRDHVDTLAPQVADIFARFPNVAKQIHNLVGEAKPHDRATICDALRTLVLSDTYLIEYQLFWIAVIAEDHLEEVAGYGLLLLAVYERSTNHKIALAKSLKFQHRHLGSSRFATKYLSQDHQTGPHGQRPWARERLGRQSETRRSNISRGPRHSIISSPSASSISRSADCQFLTRHCQHR